METKISDKLFHHATLPLSAMLGESILFVLGTSQRPGQARVVQYRVVAHVVPLRQAQKLVLEN